MTGMSVVEVDTTWTPLSLGLADPARPAAYGSFDAELDPAADDAVVLAALAVVLARHAGSRRFLLDVQGTTVGVDLTDDPSIGALAGAAGAVLAVPALPRSRRRRHAVVCRFADDPEPPAEGTQLRCTVAGRHLRIEYDRRVRTEPEVAVVAGHLRQAVHGGIADPDRRVASLPLATAAERADIATWSGRGTAASARRVHEQVLDWCHRTPDAIAIDAPDCWLTYRELAERSAVAAAALRARGVGPDDVVAVRAGRGADLIVMLLGILRAGAGYLALDVDTSPPAEVSRILRHARPALVIAEVGSTAAGAGDADLPAGSLAYVGYTSGSSGDPKGIAVPHAAVSRLVNGAGWLDIGPADAVLHASPMAFDASTLEVWGALCNGARLVIHPAGPIDLDALADRITGAGVTVAWLTAGLFHHMVDTRLAAFAGVRRLFAGGDVVSAGHVRRLLSRYPGMVFTNGYGPTENTTFTTTWSTGTPPDTATLPIGRPVDGTAVRILDEALRPVPVGVTGDLYAAGAGLARGYLHEPAATAAAFVPDPFAEAPGERMYRTGDRGRWRPDGTIEFRGRADHQVKIRGYRVELPAIEAVLGAQPEVAEAAVVAERDEHAVRHLLGYVRLADPPPDAAARTAVTTRLHHRLGDQLPRYAVPAGIVALDAFPRTGSGKIDRPRLATGMPARRTLDRPYVEPSTETQRRLARIWSAVLRIEPVGLHDNFFELGGHSLAVSRLILEIEAAFGKRVPAKAVFLSPTVFSLARNVEADR